jgi:hypothetical protein
MAQVPRPIFGARVRKYLHRLSCRVKAGIIRWLFTCNSRVEKPWTLDDELKQIQWEADHNAGISTRRKISLQHFPRI